MLYSNGCLCDLHRHPCHPGQAVAFVHGGGHPPGGQGSPGGDLRACGVSRLDGLLVVPGAQNCPTVPPPCTPAPPCPTSAPVAPLGCADHFVALWAECLPSADGGPGPLLWAFYFLGWAVALWLGVRGGQGTAGAGPCSTASGPGSGGRGVFSGAFENLAVFPAGEARVCPWSTCALVIVSW